MHCLLVYLATFTTTNKTDNRVYYIYVRIKLWQLGPQIKFC